MMYKDIYDLLENGSFIQGGRTYIYLEYPKICGKFDSRYETFAICLQDEIKEGKYLPVYHIVWEDLFLITYPDHVIETCMIYNLRRDELKEET